MVRNHDGPFGIKQEWLDNAMLRDDLAVAKKICDTVKTLDDFKPDYHILQQFKLPVAAPLSVLDFGAGLLRNTVGLLHMSPKWRIVAHDSELMLSRGYKMQWGHLTGNHHRYRLEPSWHNLRACRFDAIVCIYVLQHLEVDVLRAMLNDFRRMTPKLCVYGRIALDDLENKPTAWTNGWDIICETWRPLSVWSFDKEVNNRGINVADNLRGASDHCGAILVPRE